MRYAVYFAPAMDTALAAAGAEWLGRDAYTGERLTQPDVSGLSPERVAALTADPRRYGFHGTLKAPFELSAGKSAAALRAELADFAAERSSLSVRLTVARLGHFIALIPEEPLVQLDRLAAESVTAFDGFRAPLTPEMVARRRASGLTPRQDELMLAWGYPYVFDEFRFHMSLTGRIAGEEADRLEDAAREMFAPLIADPVPVDLVAVFVEPAPGEPFAVLDTAVLLDA